MKLEEGGESSAEPPSATRLALLGTASQALEPFRSLDEPLVSLDGSSVDVDGCRMQFMDELGQLTPEQFMEFHRVIHMLKHSKAGGGNGAGGGGGDVEEGLGKSRKISRKQLRNPFVLDEAECSNGSSDEEHNNREYETKADTDFISDAHQENNTGTSHRQCDNLDPTDQFTRAIFEAAAKQYPPDYDGFRFLF